jgi:hypothetical protein
LLQTLRHENTAANPAGHCDLLAPFAAIYDFFFGEYRPPWREG